MRRFRMARPAPMKEAALRPNRTIVVAALGTSQTLAWASSYYLPAVLGAAIAAGLGMPTGVFFAVFSAALLMQAVFGPYLGRLIDRHGGRAVLTASNAVLAAGLAMLGLAQGIVGLIVAWALLGIGMTMGLYDAAFATLTRLYGHEARASITGITLIAGFASTLGWPASAWFEHVFGWREACLIWAAVNLLVALPLNWLVLPSAPPLPAAGEATGEAREVAPPRGAMPILAFYFCTTAFVTGALQAHLLRFLETAGASGGGRRTVPVRLAARSGGGFRGAVDGRPQPVGLRFAVAVAAAPGAGGRACRQRLIRSQEVCACVSVPASQSRSSAVCQGLP